MESNIIKKFPIITENAFFCYGIFFAGFEIHKALLVHDSQKRKQEESLRGVGTSYRALAREESFFIIDFFEDYIDEFKHKISGLIDKKRNPYFNKEQIERIVDIESERDKKRSENEKPYVRLLIWSWLKKAGLYINEYVFTGYIKPISMNHLSKYSFWIKSYYKKTKEGYLIIVDNGYSGVDFFDKNFKSYDKHVKYLSLKNVDLISKLLYKGYENTYINLFTEILAAFYADLRFDVFERKNLSSTLIQKAMQKAHKIKKE